MPNVLNFRLGHYDADALVSSRVCTTMPYSTSGGKIAVDCVVSSMDASHGCGMGEQGGKVEKTPSLPWSYQSCLSFPCSYLEL